MMLQSLGKPIFGTGNHFEWGDNQILKLYGPDVPMDFVKNWDGEKGSCMKLGFQCLKLENLLQLMIVLDRFMNESMENQLQMNCWE